MNKKQQLIYNALVLDRDETKRALQMPNLHLATSKLLAAKLTDLNQLIADTKIGLIAGVPGGCTEPDIVAKVLDSYSKCGEASTKQPELYIGGFSVPITEALSMPFIEASPEATAFLEQLEGCIIESIDYAGNGWFHISGELTETYNRHKAKCKYRIQYYDTEARVLKTFVF